MRSQADDDDVDFASSMVFLRTAASVFFVFAILMFIIDMRLMFQYLASVQFDMQEWWVWMRMHLFVRKWGAVAAASASIIYLMLGRAPWQARPFALRTRARVAAAAAQLRHSARCRHALRSRPRVDVAGARGECGGRLVRRAHEQKHRVQPGFDRSTPGLPRHSPRGSCIEARLRRSTGLPPCGCHWR